MSLQQGIVNFSTEVDNAGAKAAADSPALGCVKSEYSQSCQPTIEEGARAESWGFVNAAPLIAVHRFP